MNTFIKLSVWANLCYVSYMRIVFLLMNYITFLFNCIFVILCLCSIVEQANFLPLFLSCSNLFEMSNGHISNVTLKYVQYSRKYEFSTQVNAPLYIFKVVIANFECISGLTGIRLGCIPVCMYQLKHVSYEKRLNKYFLYFK